VSALYLQASVAYSLVGVRWPCQKNIENNIAKFSGSGAVDDLKEEAAKGKLEKSEVTCRRASNIGISTPCSFSNFVVNNIG